MLCLVYQFNYLGCTNGTIRLSEPFASYGRVEICFNDVWGTICNNGWDAQDARVVCRELGFSSVGKNNIFHIVECLCNSKFITLKYIIVILFVNWYRYCRIEWNTIRCWERPYIPQ